MMKHILGYAPAGMLPLPPGEGGVRGRSASEDGERRASQLPLTLTLSLRERGLSSLSALCNPLLGLFCLLFFSCSLAHAAPSADEARTRSLAASLRCVVCQGQSLADSQAEIAIEMRAVIHEKVAAGESDEEILHYFTERYGDSILTSPPVKQSTLPLWLAPPLLLGLGLLLIRRLHS